MVIRLMLDVLKYIIKMLDLGMECVAPAGSQVEIVPGVDRLADQPRVCLSESPLERA